jgi:hypothetical protein
MGNADPGGMQEPQTERKLSVAMHELHSVSWAAWRKELGNLGRGHYERNRAIKTAGAGTWRAYYEKGYSPMVALFDVMTPGGWESLLGI